MSTQLESPLPFARAADLVRTSAASLEAFLGPVQLIGAPPALGGNDEWSFQTRAATHVHASERLGIDLAASSIFPVRKARPTFFANTILVGRAASSDIVIDHASISKLHARIRRARDGSYTIADAGSTNGTRLDGRPVTETEVPLPFGAAVRLGDWDMRFQRLVDTLQLLRSG